MVTRISKTQVQAAYRESVLVFRGKKQLVDAVETLVTEHSMNPGSARDFVNNFKFLMSGEGYNRTLNGYATTYFLAEIEKEFGAEALQTALRAVDSHIKYYDGLNHGRLRNIRGIYDNFIKRLSSSPRLEARDDFETQVARSLADSASNRSARLRVAPKIPATLSQTITIFNRNPDVVAEVLLRASGVCERCKKPAPFKRSKDGTPYLEIHHKVQLAHHGEDTVENAMAVCPNCHRELHFG
jgi:5-methylcytosine-specific restriction protein A